MENEKVFAMKFAKVYSLLVNKAVRKGRTQEEVDALIHWLCGYDAEGIREQVRQDVDYKTFFDNAPAWNPDSRFITGKICGARIEEIKDPTMWKIRCLDKIIDELAKGKTLEKIMMRKKQSALP